MSYYRKKPIVVEARQYEKGMEDGFIDAFDVVNARRIMKPYIYTLEGKMSFDEDAYIVTGVIGERWAVKKIVFEKTYEKVKAEMCVCCGENKAYEDFVYGEEPICNDCY